MSTETSAITWKVTASRVGTPYAWIAQLGDTFLLTLWSSEERGALPCWKFRLSPVQMSPITLSGIAPDDLPGAQAAALKMAEEILKPYADAYSVIAEERMR